MNSVKIRLDHIEKEHARLIALGITGYKDMMLQGTPVVGNVADVDPERYKSVQEWKKQRISAPSAPPVHKYRSIETSNADNSPAPREKKKKPCGCGARKKALNSLVPGLGDVVAAIAEPIAKHIVNPMLGTEFTSQEPPAETKPDCGSQDTHQTTAGPIPN